MRKRIGRLLVRFGRFVLTLGRRIEGNISWVNVDRGLQDKVIEDLHTLARAERRDYLRTALEMAAWRLRHD